MFSIKAIKNAAADLIKESSKTNPDINKMKIYLNDLADNIIAMNSKLQEKMDPYQFKSFCVGFNNCLPELVSLKSRAFKEVVKCVQAVLIITKTFERDPQEAYKEWGELSTIKAGLISNVGKLYGAIKNTASFLERAVTRKFVPY